MPESLFSLVFVMFCCAVFYYFTRPRNTGNKE